MVIRPVRVDKVRILALCLATVLWLPCVPAIYRRQSAGFVSTGWVVDEGAGVDGPSDGAVE